MAGERRLLLYWDPELDGAFRRRLERALADLNVNAADAAAVDIDPDAAAPLRLALLAFSAGTTSPRDADIVVLAGPGDFPAVPGAMRLETSDIENATRRWIAFRDHLGSGLGRPSLAVAAADLEVKLDEAARRADQAERALAEMERQRNDAVRAQRLAETALASERSRADRLEHDKTHLADIAETSTFALSTVRADQRPAVERARIESRLARDAAARATRTAEDHPDALAWPKANALYSGETRNRQPHGFGVMTFRDGKNVAAVYRGEFSDGVRTGHGVATSDGGHTWSGQWADGEARGFGLLETPDGRRFEGEIVTDQSATPRPGAGHTWTTNGKPSPTVHTQAPPLLPSPAQAAGG